MLHDVRYTPLEQKNKRGEGFAQQEYFADDGQPGANQNQQI